MAWIPFAFSVHRFITSVGSDAGFASIIGLAILVLLYFAQARETANLRQQAEESGQRVLQLESRLAQLSRPQASPQVGQAPVPVGAQAPANAVAAASARRASAVPGRASKPVPAGAVAAAPGAPAGVAAPALAAATKLVPTSPVAPPQPAVAAGAAPDEQRPDATVIAPAPATVAGGANGAVQERVAPPPVGAGRGVQAPGRVRGQGGGQAPPRVQIRPGGATAAARRPLVAPRAPAVRRSRVGRGLLLLIGALGAAAVVAVLLIVTSAGDRPAAGGSSRTSNAPTTRHAKRVAVFNPSSVTVAVLNGTAASGLAHRTALRLASAGYREGTIATASDQTRTATVVAYMPGHRGDALQVAKTLKLGSASVQPVDQSTQAVACPPSSACTATVVVTVGADLASQ